jgi:peptide deformylase
MSRGKRSESRQPLPDSGKSWKWGVKELVKTIVRDLFFLGQKSEETTQKDGQVIQDLQDTLAAYREGCVGMAANMIGYRKRSIIVSTGFYDLVMNNPIILSKADPYETEEGCLSLDGVRRTTRYRKIEVRYQDVHFKEQRQSFNGFIAQIIQHEMDHLDGIII